MAGERGNEHSGSIKCGQFVGKQRTCQLLRKESTYGVSDVANTIR